MTTDISSFFFDQAENEADRMDWINKITGAITSLLNSQFFDQVDLLKSSMAFLRNLLLRCNAAC